MTGETSDASRGSARHNVPKEVLAAWASDQARLITEDRFGLQERIKAAERIDSIGGDPGELSFVFCGGALVTKSKFLEIMVRERKVFVLLDARYEDRLHWESISDIGLSTLSRQLLPYVCVVGWSASPGQVFDDEDNREYVSDPPNEVDQDRLKLTASVARIFVLLSELWGSPLKVTLDRKQVFTTQHFRAPAERWVLVVEPK
jgi:hypothetical protein